MQARSYKWAANHVGSLLALVRYASTLTEVAPAAIAQIEALHKQTLQDGCRFGHGHDSPPRGNPDDAEHAASLFVLAVQILDRLLDLIRTDLFILLGNGFGQSTISKRSFCGKENRLDS